MLACPLTFALVANHLEIASVAFRAAAGDAGAGVDAVLASESGRLRVPLASNLDTAAQRRSDGLHLEALFHRNSTFDPFYYN